MADMNIAAMRRYIIIDTETGDRFEFHAMPDHESGFSVSKSANWSPTEIQGRSMPIYGYRNSESADIPLTIPIFASIEQSDGRTVQDVKKACDFFLSLAYPDYQGIIKPPHKCLLLMSGQFYPFEVVCQNVSVNYLGPWDVQTGWSYRAIVNISFIEVSDNPYDYKPIRNG